jgi:hypothetical protein
MRHLAIALAAAVLLLCPTAPAGANAPVREHRAVCSETACTIWIVYWDAKYHQWAWIGLRHADGQGPPPWLPGCSTLWYVSSESAANAAANLTKLRTHPNCQ